MKVACDKPSGASSAPTVPPWYCTRALTGGPQMTKTGHWDRFAEGMIAEHSTQRSTIWDNVKTEDNKTGQSSLETEHLQKSEGNTSEEETTTNKNGPDGLLTMSPLI